MIRSLAFALLAGTALVPAAALAQDLPTGGHVAAGQASIATPSAGAMQITQATDRAVIDWTSFDIGANARVDIAQPSATAALLNRVTGTTTSTIAGQLNANGRVFLVNPNGILVTGTGSVKAAGFVASTLDTGNAAFMAGSDELTVVAPRGNAIGVVEGGYAGLMQGRDRSTLLYAKLDTVETDGTTRGAIDLEGDGFLQVAVPEGGITVAGRITANEVVLTAGTARDAARGVVNLSGVIAADSVSGRGGTVTLTGASVTLTGATIDASGATGGGSVRIGGDWQGAGSLAHATDVSVDAATVIRADATGAGDGGRVVLWSDGHTDFAGAISARGPGGAGGDAEVSGKQTLAYAGTADLTGDSFGTLLLDPYNVTISSGAQTTGGGFTANGNDSVINVTTLQNALSTANVMVWTGVFGGQAGNITVAAPVTWGSTSRLTLSAAGSIAVNAPITVTGGGKVALNFSTADPITGGLSFASGAALTYADGQSGQALSVNGSDYTLLRSMAEVDAIDTTGLSGHYALAHDLDAGGTIYTSALVGLGNRGAFSGTLEGLGHSIANLTIAGSGDFVGLIGYLTGAVRDIGVAGGSVSGLNYVGALVGENYSGTVSNAYATATVRGGDRIGGLVGNSDSQATVNNAYATGAVSGSRYVGGLLGYNNNSGTTVSNVYATGVVSGSNDVGGLVGNNASATVRNAYATGAVSGSSGVGGLVGVNRGAVSNAYATGAISGASSTGGLVGMNDGSSINDIYATGSVSGTGNVGGLLGENYNGSVSNAYATGAVSGTTNVGGLAGYNFHGPVIKAYATGAVSGTKNVGGLVGYNDGAVSNAYATGAVSGTTYVGALVGYLNDYIDAAGGYNSGEGSFANSYWNKETSGQSFSVGASISSNMFGEPLPANVYGTSELTTAQFQSGSASGLGSAFAGGMGGLYPYLKSFYPNGVQAISGIATTSAGTLLASGMNGAKYVFATIDGAGVAPVTTGANGYYYVMLPAGTLAAGGTSVFAYTTTDNSVTGTALSARALSLTGTTANFDIAGGLYTFRTTAATWSAANAASLTGLIGPRPSGLAALGRVITATSADGFRIDQALDLPRSFSVQTTAGGITVAAPVTLAGGNALTLSSAGDLTINAPIAVTGGGKVTLNFRTTNTVTGGLSFASGSALTYADGQSGQALTVNGNAYTLVYTMDQLDRIDGRLGTGLGYVPAYGAGLSGRYALAHDLDAGATTYTGALVGDTFAGTLEGLGHSVANLTIKSSGANVGLVSTLGAGGSVRDIGLLGGSVSGTNTVGGLVAINRGTVRNAYATGTISGSAQSVGGLIGSNVGGTVSNAYATGAVSGTSQVGGLAGYNDGTVSNAYANGAVNGSSYVGGLVGYNQGGVSNAYATGAVSGSSHSIGGLLGYNGSAVSAGYWDTQTSGRSTGIGSGTTTGATGLTTAQLQSGGASALGSAFAGGTGGLYPYLKSFYPNGVQAISGVATTSSGGVASAAQVGLYRSGSLVGGGTVSSGANGYYYAILPAGTLAATGNTLGQTIALAGATAVSGSTYSDALALDASGNLSGLSVASGLRTIATGAANWSGLAGALSVTFGASRYASLAATLATTDLTVAANNAGGFSVDRALSLGAGDLTLATTGPLTLASPIAAGDITLVSGGAFANTAGATALTAGGRWLVYSFDPTLDTRGGLAPDFIQYDAGYGKTTLAQASGNGLLYVVRPTVTVGLTGSVAKTYDGTTAATLTAGNYALSGALGGDTVTLTAPTGTSYANADAGTNKLVSATGLGIAAVRNGSATVYGYRLASTTASGAVGTITPATLTYTAGTASRVYGDANPALTGTVTGFVNGETLAGATTGTLAFTTAAGTTGNVGSYAIDGSGLSARRGNYVFTQAAGNATALTVTARPITVTADALSRIYGDANPALTYTVGGRGLVNGDTLSGALATAAATTSNVGSYAITQGSLAASSNYALSYNGANLAVTARPLTIAADALSRLYMDVSPSLTYTIGGAGLVNGDKLTGTLKTAALPTSNAGSYAITQNTLAASGNYAVTYVGANLTVAPRPITLTAVATSRAYGSANPVLTYTVNKYLTAKTLGSGAALVGALTTDATTGSDAGSYAIRQGTLTDAFNPNYAITYVGANLTIQQMSGLTASATQASVTGQGETRKDPVTDR